jgi:hypothetical protein
MQGYVRQEMLCSEKETMTEVKLKNGGQIAICIKMKLHLYPRQNAWIRSIVIKFAVWCELTFSKKLKMIS